MNQKKSFIGRKILFTLCIAALFYLCFTLLYNYSRKINTNSITIDVSENTSSITTVTVEKEYTKDIIGTIINLEPVSIESIEELEPYSIYSTANVYLIDELKAASEMGLFYEEVTDHSSTLVINDFKEYITKHQFYELVANICSMINREYFDTPYLNEGIEVIPFNDYDHIITNTLHALNIIPDTTTGNLHPYSNIDKEEASIVLYNTYNYFRQLPGDKLQINTDMIIADYEDISEKYKRSIIFCNELSIMNLDNNGFIEPEKDITNEEAIVYVYRLYNAIVAHIDTVDPLYNNETNCYRLLKRYGGFNNAVLAGIMANVGPESGYTFDPDIHQYGGGPGYGICQWTTDSRKQGLYDFAEECGYPYNTLECQCQYILYELETLTPRLKTYLESVPDTVDGASNAGYQFCLIFEAPGDLEGCCQSRSNGAKKYFNEYINY